MELDTGAAVSSITYKVFQELWPQNPPDLQPCPIVLKSYTGSQIPVKGHALGSVNVEESRDPQLAHLLPLVVVGGAGQCLFGRDWLGNIPLEWQKIFAVSVGKHSMGDTVDALIAQHAAVFEPGLGCFKGSDVKIKLQANAQPKFCSAC